MKHRYLIVDRTALDSPALFDYLAEAPQHRGFHAPEVRSLLALCPWRK